MKNLSPVVVALGTIGLVSNTGSADSPDVWSPAPGTSWQWQLTGSIDTSIDVDMYDIDLFDAPQSVIDELRNDNRAVVCYFSAGSWEDWRSDADEFPKSVLGRKLGGWPGEKWLDIRQLDTLGPILEARLDLAVQKGCDGVEPDNVDGYTNNTGFPLAYQDQITFNTWLADQAHARDLSVGLKNDVAQVADLVTYFDWALNEQCFQYDECHLLLPFVDAGKAVFGVEYELGMVSFCYDANDMNLDWLKKDYDLNAYREACRNPDGTPVVYRTKPSSLKPGRRLTIIGYDFGDTQGAGIVHIGPNTFHSTSKRIKLWSDTKIRTKIPKYKCSFFKGKNRRSRKAWVTVTEERSNKKRFKVVQPDTCK
jgi:hypothetical protein